MQKFVTITHARELLAAHTRVLETESVSLDDSLGRITAKGISAALDMPNFRKSPFDGYCLQSSMSKGATADNPVILEVGGVLAAGSPPSGEVRNLPYKIMTGAEVPAGFDAVIKKEDTDCGDARVALYKEAAPGENIIRIGEDVKRGEIVLDPHFRITPGSIAMLSALGVDRVEVYRRPRIGLITTGDEVIDLGAPLLPGKVYNSNKYAIMAYLKELGAEATSYGIAADDKEILKERFQEALRENDLLLTTGGVSVGDFDFIQEIYDELGIEKLFWGVQMKPGTPALAGCLDGRLVISLPGSPAASLISFEVLAAPVIRSLKGCSHPYKQEYVGRLAEDFHKLSDMPRFLRVVAEKGRDGSYELFLSGKQNAGVLSSMVRYNALALVDQLGVPMKKGDLLRFSFNQEEEL